MPKKGTKRVRGHYRQKTAFRMGEFEFKDPLSTTYVREHYRKKRKR